VSEAAVARQLRTTDPKGAWRVLQRIKIMRAELEQEE
jgi:hypothetical protein